MGYEAIIEYAEDDWQADVMAIKGDSSGQVLLLGWVGK